MNLLGPLCFTWGGKDGYWDGAGHLQIKILNFFLKKNRENFKSTGKTRGILSQFEFVATL